MNQLLSRLARAAVEPAPQSDARLLAAFLAERSEAAFARLVERHGPMVFGVCMRVLRHRQDAEDAFQAAFVVLARRAADVWPREAVGSWLYGVAHRVALKAWAARARRRARETPLGEKPPAAVTPGSEDLAEAIDLAIRRLPESYRAAVVACDLEGLSRTEASERLGWKEGTLSGRLARARQLLAERLRRSGLALPAGGVAAAVSRGDAVACGVAAETVRLAVGGSPSAVASSAVLALSEGMVRGMFLAKLKIAAAVALVASTIGVGVWASAGAGTGQEKGAGNTPGPAGKVPGGKGALDLEVAHGQLETARKHLADTFKDHKDRDARGDWWGVDSPDGLERDIARFRADVETLDRLLKGAQTALDAARAAGPAQKVPADLVRMQGRWRVDTLWDGSRRQPVPAKDAPGFEIVGNKMYYPIRGSEARGERETYTLVLRPEAKPPEIDLTSPSGGPSIRGIYRFAAETDPRAGNLWIALAKGGLRPESFDAKAGTVEVLELTPVAADKPAADRVVDGVDLTPAERRRDLVYQELQLFLAEFQRRKPADSVQQFADQLERDRSRLDQLRQLLDQTQKEFDKEKERAKAAPPPKTPLGDPIDDAKARRAIERQRARVLLDNLKRQAAAAEGNMLGAAENARKATTALQQAEAKVAELRDKIATAQKELDELGGAAKPAASFEIFDDRGNRIPFTEGDAAALRDLTLKLFKESRGELTGGKDAPFATAARWQKLQKSGHVLVRVNDAEILVPVSTTRVPEFILARSGDTYRAVFDFPEEKAKGLHRAVVTLSK